MQFRLKSRLTLNKNNNIRFLRSLSEVLCFTKAKAIIEVGAPQQNITQLVYNLLKPELYIISTVQGVKEGKATATRNVKIKDPYLPFKDNSVDMVILNNIEQSVDPESIILEAQRITKRYIVAMVPHFPVSLFFRLLKRNEIFYTKKEFIINCNWNKRRFKNLMSSIGKIIAVRHPYPWIILLIRVYK